MPILPADRPDEIAEDRFNEADVGWWQMEAAATDAELYRWETEEQLRRLKLAYGAFLPLLYVVWFIASLTIVFFSGFGVASFDVPAAVEISAFTSLSSGVAIPFGLVARSLFTDQNRASTTK